MNFDYQNLNYLKEQKVPLGTLPYRSGLFFVKTSWIKNVRIAKSEYMITIDELAYLFLDVTDSLELSIA